MVSILKVDALYNTAGNAGGNIRSYQRRVIQRVTRWWTGGIWNPGNNYYEIPGSMISITPLYSQSYLVYTYMCPLGHRGAAHSITHWILMVDGKEYARHSRSVDHQESGSIQKWEVPSWGAGRSSSIGYVARQYSDSDHSVHFNGRRYKDGTQTDSGVAAQVTVEEVYPSYL